MCLGVPATVIAIKGSQARVEINGMETLAALDLVEGINPGDQVLLHTGFIIQKLSPEEAEETRSLIREIQQYSDDE